MQRIVLKGGRVITPWVVEEDGVVILADGKIQYVGGEYQPQEGDQVLDVTGKLVTPGLIDLHIHGGGGHDVMGGTVEDVIAVAKNELKAGVTSFVPSLYATKWERMLNSLDKINETYALQQQNGCAESQIVGIYLEAPFMNPLARGGQPIEAIRKPIPEDYHQIMDRAGDLLRLVLVAPEVEGGLELTREVLSRGLIAAVGHSEASYEEVVEAVSLGLDQAVHTFNGGNTGITKRLPGLIGAALNLDEIYCELICDGIHVHQANMQLLYKLKSSDKIILITDAVQPAGLPDGEYDLSDGRRVRVKNNTATTCDAMEGNLYGSCLGLNRSVKNMVQMVGATLPEAIKMATVNPARRLGLTNKGSLLPGNDADLAVFSPDLEVERVFIAGREIAIG